MQSNEKQLEIVNNDIELGAYFSVKGAGQIFSPNWKEVIEMISLKTYDHVAFVKFPLRGPERGTLKGEADVSQSS